MNWQRFLKYDPLLQFENITDDALQFQVMRDLKGKDTEAYTTLWELPPVMKILKKTAR